MNSRADLSITMTNRVNGRLCTTLTNRLAGDTDAEVGATKRRLGERYAARISRRGRNLEAIAAAGQTSLVGVFGVGGRLLERRLEDRRSAGGPEASGDGLGCRFVRSGVELAARACSPRA